MSKNVKTFKYNGGDETKNNKLMPLRKDDNNLLGKCKTISNIIKDLKKHLIR